MHTRNRLILALMFASAVAVATASPLVYVPVNPSFGGNPLNGSVLLNEAQAQNKHTAPRVERSPADRLQAFQDALQNAVLSRVQSAAIRQIVNIDGGLIPGTVETQDFIISVADNNDGTVTIRTTDKTTNQVSEFTISQSPNTDL
ncbi:MAG: curli assembly protein CsgF [Panacagrimonas sp.]